MVTFTYAEAEKLLGELYLVPDDRAHRGAFVARLKHLKRLGVPLGSNIGKGSRFAYEPDHLYQMCFCLELMECGIDPAVAVKLLMAQWDKISAQFRVVEDAPEKSRFYMCMTPLSLMSKSWAGIAVEPLIKALRGNEIGEITQLISFRPSPNARLTLSGETRRFGDRPRWLMFDITNIVRAVSGLQHSQAPLRNQLLT